MPRKNHTTPHRRYDTAPLAHTSPKRAYPSEQAAKRAIAEAQKYSLDLQLYPYKSPVDGKWYLSSKANE